MLNYLEPQTLPLGALLFTSGQRLDSLYLVMAGAVRVDIEHASGAGHRGGPAVELGAEAAGGALNATASAIRRSGPAPASWEGSSSTR